MQRSVAVSILRQMIVFLVICLASLAVALAATAREHVFPLTLFVVPMLVGSLVLRFRLFLLSMVVLAACVVAVLVNNGVTTTRVVVVAVLAVMLTLLLAISAYVQRFLPVALGESMLIDLRDRLLAQGELPQLPDHWYAQSALRSAGGAKFAGDFLVASRAPGSNRLEVVVVDVSGKGLDAGTRALQLSGAFGGLLGALPPGKFLPAANLYLLRQNWEEGFATAVHLMLDLDTGDFEVRTAGHPPLLQWMDEARRWLPHPSDGPALGLIEGASYLAATGTVGSGDTLLLYTDGMVESPSQDFTSGIDKLIGEAERMLAHGFENGAQRLLTRLDATNDDRALLVLHRR